VGNFETRQQGKISSTGKMDKSQTYLEIRNFETRQQGKISSTNEIENSMSKSK